MHSALSSGTMIAHLISNWSWHEDMTHGECSWTLTVATAVDVPISALYLLCLVRVVIYTAKKETTPPPHTHTHTRFTHTHSPMNANHPGLQCVCDAPLMEPLPLTDAQRLTQGHCGLIQRKSTVKHTNTKRTDTHSVNGRMDRQTNRQNAAALKNYWLQAESSHFPVTGIVPPN